MTWAIALSACACGRLQFDLIADADVSEDAFVCVDPVGHDEDADTLDDACDPCPALAGDRSDRDGDGVGDACDPNVDLFGEQIVLFDPFLGATAAWDYNTSMTFGSDELLIGTLSGTRVIGSLTPPARERYTLVGRIDAATEPHQVSIQAGPASGPGGYYCELYETAAPFILSATYTFDSIDFIGVRTTIPKPFVGGTYVLTFDHARPEMRCEATWNGQVYTAVGPIPDGLAPDVLYMAVTNAQTAFTSFTRIASP